MAHHWLEYLDAVSIIPLIFHVDRLPSVNLPIPLHDSAQLLESVDEFKPRSQWNKRNIKSLGHKPFVDDENTTSSWLSSPLVAGFKPVKRLSG